MPQPLDEAAEAAEFAALVAELKAPEADEDNDGDEAAPEGDTSADPEEDEDEDTDSGDELEDEDEPSDDEDEDEDEEELEDDEDLSADEKAAKSLFESGDIKAACKKLGIDPKIFKINARQFTAMRKGLADSAKLAKEGNAKLTQGQQLHTKAEEVYGPIVAGFQAYKGGNPLNVRAAIELMCEDSFENVVATVARAAKGLDPAQLEVIKLRKEMADRDAKQKEEGAKATQATQEKAEVKKLSTLLKSTPLAKIEGAAEEIRALVVASYDGTGYGLTVKQAYAQVKAKHAKVAAAFGGKLPTGKTGKPGKTGTKREELAPVRKDTKAMTVQERIAQKKLDEQAEFERELRAAKEDTKRGGRAARRAR